MQREGRAVVKREGRGEERRERRVEVIGSADRHRTHKSMQKSQHNCHRE